VRRIGWLLVLLGVACAAYMGVVLWHGDPVTGFYAHVEQGKLRAQLREETRTPARGHDGATAEGAAFAVIRIPRLGVDAVVVQGTSEGDLAKGPGHYRVTGAPGSGRVIAIAGHRTTFGAWFRHLDDLRRGDRILLDYRGRRYVYRVTGERIVQPTDWTILRYRGYEKLVLSTCNPVFSASQRLIVFASRVVASVQRAGASAAPTYRRSAM
jgi:sortase A